MPKLTIRSPSKGGRQQHPQQPGGATTASLAAGQPHTTPVRIFPPNLPVCIIDNGGWTVKYGLVPSPNDNTVNNNGDNGEGITSPIMKSMYNATARPPAQLTVLAGDEITTRMKNLGQLSWNMSCERGMICNGETQLRVWARTLECLNVVPIPSSNNSFLTNSLATNRKKTKPVVTASAVASDNASGGDVKYASNNCTFFLLEHPFVPSVISEGVDNILFRELGMARVCRQLGACMAAINYVSYCQSLLDDKNATSNDDDVNNNNIDSSQMWFNDRTNCCCVVDSGYSFTHVVPTHLGGKAVIDAIRRLNVGGKVLTNLLKESVTYRQWNMMDEYHIVNDAKEQLCFVSSQFDKEMALARVTRKGLRWFDREYLLPDFVITYVGSARLPEPLQRKREMEEMESMKLEIAKLDNEKHIQELANEAKDLVTDIQEDDNTTNTGEMANNKRGQKRSRSKSHKSNKEKSKRSKHKSSTKAVEEFEENDEIDDKDESECDDDETQQQRLHRLKTMRDEERKRREQESRDRQALALSVERFAIPEVLFRPTDIGLDCGGIAETIVESITACDPILRASMYHNVLLVGGNAKIPGLKERLELELRQLAPTNYKVRVYLPNNDPASYAWEGAIEFAQMNGFQERFSVDRLSWERLKKSEKNQKEIWGNKVYKYSEHI